ncbi:2-hydroxyacyl-CoA dehydratase subunit D [Chloroflexota bacterium]
MPAEKGLARVKSLSENRNQRVLELKAEGKKIIGYMCCYPPAEILTAADVVPYRIMGNIEKDTIRSDTYLESNMCPFVRNCFEMVLDGEYSFLDGILIPHSCDAMQRIFGFWRHFLKPKYLHYLEVPHVLSESGFKFYEAELLDVKETLEEWLGSPISDQSIQKAIQLHNQTRALIRQIYDLRKSAPPLISGSEVLQTLIAILSLPAQEANELLESIIAEVKSRKDAPGVNKKQARLLLYGGVVDNTPLIKLIEECGGQVVMDDQAIGTRTFWFEVKQDGDLLYNLSRGYLTGIRCPRTIVGEKTESHEVDLDNRFGYLLEYARDFNVDGILLDVLPFCDMHQFDIPDLQDYLKEKGVKATLLNDNYTSSGLGFLKLRIMTFLEILGGV